MIPVELITLAVSTIGGSILRIWGMKQQMKQEQHVRMMEALRHEETSRQSAREDGSERFQWTQMIIALSVVLSVVVLPKLMPLIAPWVPVTVGWTTTSTKGFWPFVSESSGLVWHVARGLVLTPLDTHLVSAIAGLYFGGSLIGRYR